MQCKYHPDREAVSECGKCGAKICQSCLVELGPVHLCKACHEAPLRKAYGISPDAEIRTVEMSAQSVVLGPHGMEMVDADADRLRCPACQSRLRRIPQPFTGMGPTMTEYRCESCNKTFSRLWGVMTDENGGMYASRPVVGPTPSLPARPPPVAGRPPIPRPPSMPRPVPTAFSYATIAGLIMLMIAAPVYWGLYLAYRELGWAIPSPSFWGMMVVLSMVMGTGSVIGAFTHYGFYRKFGSSLGKTAFTASLLLPWLLAAHDLLALGDIDLPSMGFHVTTRFALWFAGFALFGATLILWGLSYLTIPKSGKESRAISIAGALFLIAGLCYVALIAPLMPLSNLWRIIYFQAGAFLLIPAAILAITALLKRP